MRGNKVTVEKLIQVTKGRVSSGPRCANLQSPGFSSRLSLSVKLLPFSI